MWTHPDILLDLAKQHRDDMTNQAEHSRLLAAARRHRTGHRRGRH